MSEKSARVDWKRIANEMEAERNALQRERDEAVATIRKAAKHLTDRDYTEAHWMLDACLAKLETKP